MVVAVTFLATIVLWVFGKQLGINANTVAMLPIAIFALTGVVTAKDLKEIDWAVIWLAAGENPEWVARQLGHSTTEMLFRVYSRYIPNVTRRDGSAFEAMLERLNTEELAHEQ